MRHEIEHTPGSMISDEVETKLGKIFYREVKNLRQIKKDEWQSVPGYKNIVTAGTAIKAAVEINDDLSGDRFILLQDNTSLKRLDYDSGNSPIFGYENESASTLTLPDGVTIASGSVLRFFTVNGVTRISGASEPLWYSYVKRTLFKSVVVYEFTEDNQFYQDWTATNATKAFIASAIGGIKNSLQVIRTLTTGGVSQEFYTESGVEYTVSIQVYKPTQANDTVAMNVGTTDGGSEYSAVTGTSDAQWVTLTHTFTASSTSLFIKLLPRDASGGTDTTYWYNFQLYSTAEAAREIDIEDWVLTKTKLLNYVDKITVNATQFSGDTDSTRQRLWLKCFFVYDNQQYSLPGNPGNSAVRKGNNVYTGYARSVHIDISIDGSNLQSGFFNKRLTGLGILYAITSETILNDLDADYRLLEIINLDDFVDDYRFYIPEDNSYYNTSNKDRLILNQGSDPPTDFLGYFEAGAEVILKSENGEVHTTVDSITTVFSSANDSYIVFDDNITALRLSDSTGSITGGVEVTLKRPWRYGSGSGYNNNIGISMTSTPAGSTFQQLAGYPDTVTDISPNYAHHVTIEGVSYVDSLEDTEEDQIRYSPVNQPDVLPVTNIFPTEFGTLDTIKALVKRDGRLVILKGDLIGQGNFVGGRFYHDIESLGTGLFADNGYLVVGKTLLFADKDDIYQFVGVEPSPLLSRLRIQQRYKDGVTTGVLMFENQLDNEIWVYLPGSTEFLVWRPKMNEWFVRTVDYTPIGGFIDADRKLIFFDATKFITYDHGLSTFDETLTWSFTIMLHTERDARYFKKLHEVQLEAKNGIVQVISTDEQDTTTQTDELTPGSTAVQTGFVQPKFFYKQLNLKIQNKTGSTSLATIIRNVRLKADIWR